jgi:hypothetical protein
MRIGPELERQITMKITDDASLELHTLAFLGLSLPKAEWTHAGHFGAALWLLRHHPELTSPTEIRNRIMAYNEATNTPNTDYGGYHHTITLASIRAAADQLSRSPINAELTTILTELMASPFGKSDWLLSFWSHDVLFSVPARRSWVEPDLQPLPF